MIVRGAGVNTQQGLSCYIGAPQTGKTTAALFEARAAAAALGWHLLVIDSIGAPGMAALPGRVVSDRGTARAEREILERACSGGGCSTWTPPDEPRLEWMLGALTASRAGCVVLVDEWSLWMTSHKVARVPSLLRVCRTWSHDRVRLFMTTQAASGDIPRVVRDCAPRWSIFRMTQEASAHVCRLLALPDDVRARVPLLKPGERFLLESSGEGRFCVVPKRACAPLKRSRSARP